MFGIHRRKSEDGNHKQKSIMVYYGVPRGLKDHTQDVVLEHEKPIRAIEQ